jgi:hypothetical protein
VKIINSQNKITNVLIVGNMNYNNMTVLTAGSRSLPTYVRFFGIHSCLLYCNTPILCKLELEGRLFVTNRMYDLDCFYGRVLVFTDLHFFEIHSCLLYCNTPILCKLELEGRLFVTNRMYDLKFSSKKSLKYKMNCVLCCEVWWDCSSVTLKTSFQLFFSLVTPPLKNSYVQGW